jgi:hypothetical protein
MASYSSTPVLPEKITFEVNKDGTLNLGVPKWSTSSSSPDTVKSKNVLKLFVDVKDTFVSIISSSISLQRTLHDGMTLMVIALGKSNTDQVQTPKLDLSQGHTRTDGWTEERTLKQYIEGIIFKHSNLPNYVLTETLRYLHTDPKTQTDPIKIIEQDTFFKPVLPDKLSWGPAYVQLHKIFQKDQGFLNRLNDEISKIHPGYCIKIVIVEPTHREVQCAGHSLKLRNRFLKLVIGLIDSRPTHFVDVTAKHNVKSDDVRRPCTTVSDTNVKLTPLSPPSSIINQNDMKELSDHDSDDDTEFCI